MKLKSIDQISNWFDPRDWDELGLDSIKIRRNLKLLVRANEILDARFFPQFDGDRLDRVHLLFVTENIVHHGFLGHKKFIYSAYPIINISVRIEFTYSPEGELQSLLLLFDAGQLKEDGTRWCHYLEAPAKARTHMISLVSLITKLKARSK